VKKHANFKDLKHLNNVHVGWKESGHWVCDWSMQVTIPLFSCAQLIKERGVFWTGGLQHLTLSPSTIKTSQRPNLFCEV
jgi:hypothetical protein